MERIQEFSRRTRKLALVHLKSFAARPVGHKPFASVRHGVQITNLARLRTLTTFGTSSAAE